MSDAHSQMIHSFESILFKGSIKAVGKPVNRFEWFVQFPAAHAESSEALKSLHCTFLPKAPNICIWDEVKMINCI